MRFPVTNESRFLSESLAAYIADIGSFSGMNEKMLPESRSTSESFTAYGTSVRSVTSVGHHMLFQSMIFGERFAAFLANETLPSLVLEQNVLVQIRLRHHATVADVAFVFGLEMGPFLMNVQRITVRTRLSTDVAYYGSLLVLESYVQSHVALDLKLLSAYFAGVLKIRRMFPLQMFLQSSFALTFEFAHVARVLFSLLVIRRVFPSDVGMQGGSFGAFKFAHGTIENCWILGFLVIRSHVYFERHQSFADLGARLALVFVRFGIVHPGVVTFQIIFNIEIHVANTARVARGSKPNFLPCFFLALYSAG